MLRNQKTLFLDIDGVFADFSGYLKSRHNMSFDETPKSEVWKTVNADENFWINLPVLSGAHELWKEINHLNPIFLTGSVSDYEQCRKGKQAWIQKHFQSSRCIVTKSSLKSQYACKGDVLVDDMLSNCLAWEATGNNFVHHVSHAATLEALKNLGIFEDKDFSTPVYSHRKSGRDGYVGFHIPLKSQKQIFRKAKEKFAFEGWKKSCNHITKSASAGRDIDFDFQRQVEVTGLHYVPEEGVCVAVARVSGNLHREDGNIYHITIAYDHSNGVKPSHSNIVLKTISNLENLPTDERISFVSEYRLFNRQAHQTPELSSVCKLGQ